jgi:predicted transposase YbfD/YdcC
MNSSKLSLPEALAEIPDFRQASGRRYELWAILLLICVALLCGYRSQAAIGEWGKNYGPRWLRRLGIRRMRGPSQSTIQRVLAGVAAATVEAAIGRWAQQFLPGVAASGAELEGVAVDGKKVRGASRASGQSVALLSALSQRLGVVLQQAAIATSEQAEFEDLIAELVLTGCVVTTDALHTTAENAAQVLRQGGDYLFVVKDNQPTLRAEIELVFQTTTLADTIAEVRQTDQHGTRIEERHLQATPVMAGCSDWPGLQQVLRLERRVTDKRTHETRSEVVYGVTSLAPARATPAQLLALWRGHWAIENKLHWVRDVTYGEDASAIRSGSAPQVMAALRNLALSLFRLAGETNIAAACRRYAAQPALAFAAIER